MSAFVCGHDHIDALLTFAMRRDTYGPVSYWLDSTKARVTITRKNADEIGAILLDENERSVGERYTDCRPGDFPGTIGQDASSYRFREWTAPLTAVSVLKACNCFDYQACETDDYRASLANTIIEAIRHRAIGRLPGYDDAAGWEFRRPAAIKAA
jgi:hypothetical protein